MSNKLTENAQTALIRSSIEQLVYHTYVAMCLAEMLMFCRHRLLMLKQKSYLSSCLYLLQLPTIQVCKQKHRNVQSVVRRSSFSETIIKSTTLTYLSDANLQVVVSSGSGTGGYTCKNKTINKFFILSYIVS